MRGKKRMPTASVRQRLRSQRNDAPLEVRKLLEGPNTDVEMVHVACGTGRARVGWQGVGTKRGRQLPDSGSESGLRWAGPGRAGLQSPSLSSAASLALTAAPALVGVVVACAHRTRRKQTHVVTAGRSGTAASCLPHCSASTQSYLGSCTGRRPAEGTRHTNCLSEQGSSCLLTWVRASRLAALLIVDP